MCIYYIRVCVYFNVRAYILYTVGVYILCRCVYLYRCVVLGNISIFYIYRDIYQFSYRYRAAFLLTIYRAIDIPRYWFTLSRASKLHLRKMTEHLDFDKELLAKKGPTKLVIWTYSDTCKDASTKRRIVCSESVGKVRKGSLLAVKVETLRIY